MRLTKTSFIILAVAGLAMAGGIVSCQKEQMPSTTQQGRSTHTRIKDFQRQLKAVESNPYAKTVTYMSIADAVWNIEALFNYTYAYPSLVYGQTVCCDTTLFLPVCANDSVSLADLSVFNGQMYETVQTLYHNTMLNNKQFIILDVEAGQRNGYIQAIELHTVQGSVKGEQPNPGPPQMWEPFEEGILWYYGKDHENSHGLSVDAADTLTGMLNALLVDKAPLGSEYVYSNVKMKYTDPGENIPFSYAGYPNVSPRYCEFYKANPSPAEYWLNSDQMNYYYFGERHLVLYDFPNSVENPVPVGHSLFHIIVMDIETSNKNSIPIIEHYTMAYYGYREAISQDSINHGDM